MATGYRHTAEAIAKMRARTFSEETRAKMRAAMVDRVYTDETRAKMAASHTGMRHSAETLAKMSIAQKGRVVSAETREKLAAANRGKPCNISPETRAKAIASVKAKAAARRAIAVKPVVVVRPRKTPKPRGPMSAEQKAKISAGHKRNPWTPERRAAMSAALRGRTIPLEARLKMSIAAKNKPPHSAETRRRMSEANKGRTFSSEHRANLRAAWEDGRCHIRSKYTSLARALHGHLQNQGLVLEPEVRFGRFTVDLYDRDHHVAYEADAKFWHDRYEARDPGCHTRRDVYLLERFALRVVHFTDEQISALTGWTKANAGKAVA